MSLFLIFSYLFLKDVVEFDNSFSYLRSKKIWYSITIELSKPVCQNDNLDYWHAEICNWINNGFACLDIKGHDFFPNYRTNLMTPNR
jgi:hypothetical protein